MNDLSTRDAARRRGTSRPLMAWVIVALVLVGLLPIGISAIQIWVSHIASLQQAQALHLAVARSIAAEIEASLRVLSAVASSAVLHPALVEDPGSEAARDLLAGLPQALPEIAAAGLYKVDGDGPELVWLARQRQHRQVVERHLRADDPRRWVLAREAPARREEVSPEDRLWIRLRLPLLDERLALFLLADAQNLETTTATVELGERSDVVLADLRGEVLAGTAASLDVFSAELIAQAAGKLLRSGVGPFRGPGGERLVGAWADVADSPWYVVSQQPAKLAAASLRRIRRTSLAAFTAALVLTLLVTLAANRSIVRPLRRLAAAQRRLAGVGTGSAHGGEIAQLEESFAQIERNLHDREALNRIFLGRYQVVEVLGAGAMGTVFRGWDPRLERPVALKTVKIAPEDLPSEERRKLADSGERQEHAERLVKEAVTLARLQHPNIVTVFDVLHDGAHAFIAMELIDGESLEGLLWRRHRLPPSLTVPVAIALVKALEAAHREGFVHHDVKPGNILLGVNGAIKVTDFGVSELLSQIRQDRDSVCGTPGYLAPETLLRRGYSPRSDLFAAGVVIYECLTGQRPFRGDTLREVLVATAVEEPPPPEDLIPEMPAELGKLVADLLEKVPEDRPADAREVLEVLERLADEREWTWKHEVVQSGDGGEESDASDHVHTVLLPTLDRDPRGELR